MTRPPKKNSRPRRPRLDPARRAQRILDDLRSLTGEVAREEGLGRRERLSLSELELPLILHLEPGRDGGDAGKPGRDGGDAERLLSSLRDRVRESMKAQASFRMGQVYCFRCDEPDCEHAYPIRSSQVFSGYQATGKPHFKEFLQVCTEEGFQGVERLYGDPPDVIARVQTASELKGELLPGFGRGSRTYNVLGQVIIGWAPPRFGDDGDPDSRLALTFQVVETRGGSRHLMVRLNMLGLSMDRLAQLAADQGYRSRPERLMRIIRTTREHLERQTRRLLTSERRGDPVDTEQVVVPILNRLRSDLEALLRPRGFRTVHAESRHREGRRPTPQARRDALEAPAEKVYLDTRAGTIVIHGPRGRAHVFTPDGRHVTSLNLDPGEIDRKTGKRRWRPASTAERERLVRSLQGDLSSE